MQTATETTKKNGKLPTPDRDLGSMADSVTEYGRDLIHASEEKIKTGVKYAKKYPVHTAIGVGIVGFALGFLTKSFK